MRSVKHVLAGTVQVDHTDTLDMFHNIGTCALSLVLCTVSERVLVASGGISTQGICDLILEHEQQVEQLGSVVVVVS